MGCASSGRPWFEFSGYQTSEHQDCARAAARLEVAFGGVIRDQEAEDRIERLAWALAKNDPDLPKHYHCRLLNSTQLNAASLPGGRLYITRAFYAELQDDQHLAAVIAHELAHLAAGDHTRGRCRTRELALQREMAADRDGVSYLRRAGYRQRAMAEAISLIADEQPVSWLDSRLSGVEAAEAFVLGR